MIFYFNVDSFQDKQSKPMDSNATIRMNEDLLDTNHNSIAISSQLISLGGKLVASGDCASSGYGNCNISRNE